MSFDFTTLITDRTQADVDRVKVIAKKIESGTASESELAEWNAAALKGSYNYTDLNRVESAVDYIQTYLNGLQVALDTYRAEHKVANDPLWNVPWSAFDLLIKKDWVIDDIPNESDLARYLSNVDVLTDAIAITKQLPGSMAYLDYIGANEIERALMAEYDAATAYEVSTKLLIDNTAAAFVYSGEFYGGEI